MLKREPKLYIFDADGTLRYTTIPGQDCPNKPGEWRLLPNVHEKLSQIPWSPDGPYLGIASNQGGVGLGYMSKEMAQQLLEEMVRAAVGYIPPRAMIEMCTCAPRQNCECRKPKPGMLIKIIHELGVSRPETLFVGDMDKDEEAARRARIPFMWAKDFFGWSK